MRTEKEIEQAMEVCGLMAVKHCTQGSAEYNQFIIMASTMGWVLGKDVYSQGTDAILGECYKMMKEVVTSHFEKKL